MADKEEVKDKAAEGGAAPEVEAGKSNGLMKMIIIGVIVFVVGIAAFSFMMGVFSAPESADSEQSSEQASETKDSHENADGKEASEADTAGDDYLSDIAKLENELFGIHEVGDAKDMDDIMTLVDDDERGMTVEDSAKAVKWLDKEKTKITKDRAELDARKKELDTQEYRLKQIIANVNQMQSARMGSLAKLYDGMKPEQVAPLLVKLSEDQAVGILLKMKPGNAAKILGSISPDRAARISARMITLSEE